MESLVTIRCTGSGGTSQYTGSGGEEGRRVMTSDGGARPGGSRGAVSVSDKMSTRTVGGALRGWRGTERT